MAEEMRSSSQNDSNDAVIDHLTHSRDDISQEDQIGVSVPSDMHMEGAFIQDINSALSNKSTDALHGVSGAEADGLLSTMSQEASHLLEVEPSPSLDQFGLQRIERTHKDAGDSADNTIQNFSSVMSKALPIDARCQICNDRSSGLHYGVLACEGCKGFFRRALQDVGDPNRRKCYYNKDCDITVATRNRCQYCRLQKCLLLGMSRGSAKLGRRSRRMRETIAEACKTIEDNQTAQALHGLLSLKADGTPITTTEPSIETTQSLLVSTPITTTHNMSHTTVESHISNIGFTLTDTSSGAVRTTMVPMATMSPSMVHSQQNTSISDTSQPPNSDDAEVIMEYRLQKARKCNAEVFNRNRNRLRNLQSKMHSNPALTSIGKPGVPSQSGVQVFKLSQDLAGPGTKLLIVNTDRLSQVGGELNLGGQQTFLTTPSGEVIDMSNVQIINSSQLSLASPNQNFEKFIITQANSDQPINFQKTVEGAGQTPNQDMFRSPLKKRPYRPSEGGLDDSDSLAKRSSAEPLSGPSNPNLSEVSANATLGGTAGHVMLIDEPHAADVPGTSASQVDVQSVNMADVATTVYDAYIETVQFTFNNTMSMRENLADKLVCPPMMTVLDEHQAAACWKAYESRFNEAIADVVSFAKRIPGFSALETDDQIILIKGGSFEVACVMQASFIEPDSSMMLLSGIDSAYTRQQLRNSFIMGPAFVDMLFNFARAFCAFRLTDVETALFCALMLIRPDRGSLTNKDKVTKLQEILLQALQTQIDENHRSEPGLFAKLLMVVSNLRELNSEQRRVLTNLRGQIEFAEGLLAEIFDLTE